MIDVRNKILEKADQLFQLEGIRAIGVDRLSEEAGVAKTTLYRHFGSKEDLVHAYLTALQERAIGSMRQVLADAPQNPRDRVTALFIKLSNAGLRPNFYGCPFLRALAEYAEEPSVRSIAATHKHQVRALFAEAVQGISDPDGNLSGLLALLYEGTSVMMSVEKNTQAAVLALRNVDLLLAYAARH